MTIEVGRRSNLTMHARHDTKSICSAAQSRCQEITNAGKKCPLQVLGLRCIHKTSVVLETMLNNKKTNFSHKYN
jgi:hypothetical protein